jgi:hypothetical protein
VDEHAVSLQLDAGRVDELLGLVVVGEKLDLDPPVERGVDLDVAGVQLNLNLGGPLDFECLLHLYSS